MRSLKKLMLVALFAIGMLPMTASAQSESTLPVDKAVRTGKLANGLTYYIRHNEYPKGQAEFYIAQKVGSIVEEDNQRGLAHFLEHMCFNGTKSFKGNEMLKWCESVGIKFGQNINAATGVDQTVYNISKVPTARVGVQDTCLLILREWADGLLLDNEEIDAERKVIHEEWRSRMVGQMRILENLLPTIYPGTKYGYRLPIGTMEVVDNFPYQALRDYYETWYRPDLQGIMIVGDVDVDRIEAKVKELFSEIKMPENAKKREYFEVPDNKETIYAIGTDKEQPSAIIEVMYKHPAFPDSLKNDAQYLGYKYLFDMAASMMNARFSEMASKPDAKFAYAGMSDGEFLIAKTKDAMTFVALAKNNDIDAAYRALNTEIARVKKYGFLQSEYLRAREEYLSSLEKAYNNRNQQNSGALVQEYVQNFLSGEPIPGIEYEYSLMNMIAKSIPVVAINQIVQQVIGDENRVVIAMLPEVEGIKVPTKESCMQIEKEVAESNIEEYVDNVKTEPLIASLPAKGKIVKETYNKEFDAKEWTLSNGAKVIAKKTDFKADEILLYAVAKGGVSTLPAKDANNVSVLPLAMSQRGLGSFNSNDLEKYLAGKQASLSYSADGTYTRSISGSTTPKDLKTMMEMLYMSFVGLHFDKTEFAALQNQYASLLQNQVNTPEYVFQTRMAKALYKSPFSQMLTVEGIKSADCARVEAIAQNAYSNAAEFTFVFSGNFDETQLKEYVEQYIATMPANAKKIAKVKLAGMDVNPGTATQTSTYKMQTEQTYGSFIVSANLPFTQKNSFLTQVVSQILTARFLEQIREKEGATYSVWTNGSMSRIADFNVTFNTTLPMKPEKKDRVVEIVKAEFNNLANDCNETELGKVKEYMVKDITESRKKNGNWVANIANSTLNGVDMLKDAENVINSITVDDVKQYIKSVVSQGNFQIYLMDPEK